MTISAFEALCERYGVRPPAFVEELGDIVLYPDAVARAASMSLDETVDHVTSVARERLTQSA